MEFKGTQGKWSFYALDGGAFDVQVDGAGQYGGILVLASRNSHSGRAKEMHANGKLMAAAPELLDALQSFMKGAEAMGWNTDKALAAIRKATE